MQPMKATIHQIAEPRGRTVSVTRPDYHLLDVNDDEYLREFNHTDPDDDTDDNDDVDPGYGMIGRFRIWLAKIVIGPYGKVNAD